MTSRVFGMAEGAPLPEGASLGDRVTFRVFGVAEGASLGDRVAQQVADAHNALLCEVEREVRYWRQTVPGEDMCLENLPCGGVRIWTRDRILSTVRFDSSGYMIEITTERPHG